MTFPRDSAFDRTGAIPPPTFPRAPVPPRPLRRPSGGVVIAHEELESWYATLNDLYSTRTSARIPEAVGEALADLRDSIYSHLR